MNERNLLAERFEENRGYLRGVAYRMLGSLNEADDAVQECWIKLSRSDAGAVENLRAWLTTVVAHICLDMLRSRTSRREDPLDTTLTEPALKRQEGLDPEQATVLAESVGLALLVVLDTLGPAERLAFVLHDMFAVPFDEIASIVGRTPDAARQLASRARQRIQGAPAAPKANLTEQRRVVDAFLTALRSRDMDGLLAVLDPNVVARIDEAAARPGAPREVRGALDWAKGAVTFAHLAKSIEPMLVNGEVALVWAPHGRLARVLQFTLKNGKIAELDVIADPTRLRQLDLAVLPD